MDRVFLSKPNNMELRLNDVILEVSRFNKEEYVIYQITKIFEDGGCELYVLKSTTIFKQGRTVTGVIDCFFGGKNSKWLCYFLPAGRVLYGTAETV